MTSRLTATGNEDDLRSRVADQRWYHTMELAPDLVTRGWFDLRPYVSRYGLPERMDGMRVLDVGTWDGFWAFEMERRGANVVALDVEYEHEYDYPPRRRPSTFPNTRRGDGFRLAKEILGSAVERLHCNIYEATPDRLGTFDLVFVGTILVHLRDQMLALERIANLSHDRAIITEEYDRASGLVPFPVSRYFADRDKAVVFWLPSKRTWRRMISTSGFDRIEEHGRFTTTFGSNAIREVCFHAWKSQ